MVPLRTPRLHDMTHRGWSNINKETLNQPIILYHEMGFHLRLAPFFCLIARKLIIAISSTAIHQQSLSDVTNVQNESNLKSTLRLRWIMLKKKQACQFWGAVIGYGTRVSSNRTSIQINLLWQHTTSQHNSFFFHWVWPSWSIDLRDL